MACQYLQSLLLCIFVFIMVWYGMVWYGMVYGIGMVKGMLWLGLDIELTFQLCCCELSSKVHFSPCFTSCYNKQLNFSNFCTEQLNFSNLIK
jgi:hypothetical protein